MSIDESKWQEVDPTVGGWDTYNAIRINTTTGTAQYDPPTVELLGNNDTWTCIYAGGNNGPGWTSYDHKLAFLLDEINGDDFADLVDWLESNVSITT
jgi:hypothetical protein